MTIRTNDPQHDDTAERRYTDFCIFCNAEFRYAECYYGKCGGGINYFLMATIYSSEMLITLPQVKVWASMDHIRK